MEPLLRCLNHHKSQFAPTINHVHVSHSAYADDLSIFVKRSSNIKFIKDTLSCFEFISGLKVNCKKTHILHQSDDTDKIEDWAIVRESKILGILFPTSNRKQIDDTITKLHDQLAFWKRLKLTLYTKIILLNTYTKFQFTLSILNYLDKDVKKINKLIDWGLSNKDTEFITSYKYNPLFSCRRSYLSKQQFGFHFEHRLNQAQLARISRITHMHFSNVPSIYFAQGLNSIIGVPEDVNMLDIIPPALEPHFSLWNDLNVKLSLSTTPRSSSFKKFVSTEKPSLHETPSNVPNLDKWPIIKKLHVPPSTKSFLLKLYMNALPTDDRCRFGKDESDETRIRCPSCKAFLTGQHFFSGKCLAKYGYEIFKWCDKHWIKRPRFEINFDRNIDLMFMNTLWKTVCTSLHKTHLKLPALQHSAKKMFVHELRLAKTIFPKDYVIFELNLSKLNVNNLLFRYSLVDITNTGI